MAVSNIMVVDIKICWLIEQKKNYYQNAQVYFVLIYARAEMHIAK